MVYTSDATFMAAIPVGIFRTDALGNCIYVSERCCQIAGFTPETAMGWGWQRNLHPDERHQVIDTWRQAVQENRPFQMEYRLIHPDGGVRWVYGQAVAERDAQGQIVGYVGTLTDISDRKAAEQALKVQRDFNERVADITSRFVDISTANLDAEIDHALQLIGKATQADTCYLIQFSELDQPHLALDKRTLSMTHEWCRPGYSRQISVVQALPWSTFPWANTQLLQRCVVRVPDVADLPAEAMIDQLSWQRLNIKASLSVPLVQQSTVAGLLGFASFSQTMTWDDATIRLLKIVGQAIASAQERIQTEQSLYDSEERLRLALEAANQGLYDLNVQTGDVLVNPEYARLLGYDPTTFHESSATWMERLHPDDRDPVVAVYHAYIAGDIPKYEVEFRLQTQRGEYKWFLSVGRIVAWDAEGNPLRMLGIHTDITKNKQAEAARLQAETIRLELESLQKTLDRLLPGYWDWDIPNHREYLSSGFKRMFGYEDHEVSNTPESWQNLIFPEDLPGVLDCFNRHVQSHGKVPYYNEVRYRHKDGSTVWVICSGQVIAWDTAGNPLRMIGCHIDINDRKQVETDLLKASAQLEVYNRELEAFAYSVSHDLRAPLRAIDGFSKALLEDYRDQLDEDAQDYFDRIRKNVSRMGLLIDDLLKLSRVSRSDICYTCVDLSAIAEEVMGDLQASEPERSIEVAIAPNAMVHADATLMRVALTNLLQNAWKFTSHHPMAQIEFGVMHEADQPTYFIRDDGAGFDMAYSKKLFGVFQRLHDTHEFSGTGIGLATVQRVIHRHGGKVWAEGAIEQGATFYFTIPSPLRT